MLIRTNMEIEFDAHSLASFYAHSDAVYFTQNFAIVNIHSRATKITQIPRRQSSRILLGENIPAQAFDELMKLQKYADAPAWYENF